MTPSPVPPVSGPPRPRRPLAVAAARDLGPQFDDNPHRMVGQDGAFSFLLPDGNSFWFFGDTLVGRRPPSGSPWMVDGKLVDHRDMTGQGTYERMINNTGLILPPQPDLPVKGRLGGYRYLLDAEGQLKNLIPLDGDEHADFDRVWCQHGVALGERIVLSFIQVRMLTPNTTPLPIGFEIVGSGLAIAAAPEGLGDEWAAGSLSGLQFHRVTAPVREDGVGMGRRRHILWDADEPHFGVAFFAQPMDPYLYLFGTVNRSGHTAHLARVRAADVHRLEAYEYCASAGPTWSRRVEDAAALFGGMPSEMSVSYNAHLGAYLAVHSLDLTGRIVARTAEHLWGPWSEPVTLWQAEAAHAYPLPYPFPLIYAGKEHPQLSPDGGRTIYLTYLEFEEYFPHLIEVRLD